MRDELDNLIDSTLSGYSTAEPLAGLEQRVLNRVRAAEASRRRRRFWTLAALAGPAFAALAILLLIRPGAPPPAPVARVTAPAVRVAPESPAPPPAVSPEKPRPSVSGRAPVARPSPQRELPKRNVFPTPAPVTPEERMLVELAVSHPQQLLIQPVEHIEIKPIEIAPLQADGGGQ
jgi:hypothetical protein